MKEFLINNWNSILFLALALIYVLYLIVNRRWEHLRKIAFRLIRQAEKTIIGTKMGRERFDQVLGQLYSLLPKWLRLFVPKSALERKLQEWFNEVKDYLDDGKINNSINN